MGKKIFKWPRAIQDGRRSLTTIIVRNAETRSLRRSHRQGKTEKRKWRTAEEAKGRNRSKDLNTVSAGDAR